MKISLIVILILLMLALPASAQDSIIEQMIRTRDSIVEVLAENTDIHQAGKIKAGIDSRTGRMIVARQAVLQSFQRAGAGVIIHPDGIIVTNAHTANKASMIKITLGSGESFFAQPVKLAHDLDLLLLKIDAGKKLPYVPFADSDHIQLGQDVITIGNSAFLKNTISGGKIIGIGVNRKLKYIGQQRTDLIQTSINLYQGDSGGPLFDEDGRLIGLMTADEGANDHSSFAIPSNKIRESLVEYLNTNDL
ncbi:MAG: trypsin-like peptidase domain-containing protein [Candidatus Omnitrophota bacterium]